MKRLYFVFLLILTSLSSWAYDVEIGGIYYNLDKTKHTATVTFKESGYKSYSGDVIIPDYIYVRGSSVDYEVIYIGVGAFSGCTMLSSIEIGTKIIQVPDGVFSGCTKLTSISVTNGNKIYDSRENSNAIIETKSNTLICGCKSTIIPNSVKSIGSRAFEECSGLTSIDIPNSVKSIGSRAFKNCTGLTSIEIPNSVKTIGSGAFNGCTGLTSIDIQNSVTSIGSEAFKNCTGLTSIEIPNSIAEITDKAFEGCTGLTSLSFHCKNIGNWFGQNSNITNITMGNEVEIIDDRAFKNFTGLTSIEIPNSVTSIGNSAFYGCSALTSIMIPDSVKSIGESIFYGCSGLTSVKIGNGVTSIGNSAFYGCSSLTSIMIPDSVKSIGESIFYGCSGLTSVKIGNGVTSIGKDAFMYCTGLTSIDIPNSVTEIAWEAFCKCTGLTSIEIPNSVTSIGSYAFSGCTSLNTVKIPTGLATIEECSFRYCTGLTSIEIPNSVTSIGKKAFEGCTGLTTIIIPNSVISLKPYAFTGCTGLTSIEIPNSLTWINEYTFYGCSGLTSLKLPKSITKIGQSAFADCTSLTSIEIPKSVEVIDLGAFSGCTHLLSVEIDCYRVDSWFSDLSSLKDVKLGNNVNVIESKAFKGCTGLVSINIPYSVTSIGGNVFDNCTSLSSVEIDCTYAGSWFAGLTSLNDVKLGDNLISIGNGAFNGCTGLESLELPDGIIDIGYNISQSKILVNKGTKTLLTIWNHNQKNPNYAYSVFNKTDEQELLPPTFNVISTQTTATVAFDNVDLNDGFTYSYNNETLNETEIKHTALKPDTKQNVTLVVSKDETSYTINGSYTTMGLNPRIDDEQYEVTASSIRAKGSYTEEDAKVVAQRMYIRDNYYYNTNDITNAEGEECFAFGLNPGRRYSVVCEIDVDYGGDSLATFRGTKDIYTKGLQFSVAQPKVVNLGNAIVSATVNLDPEEENVGFEWRRTDWTNEFPSNTGKAYLYEGVLEGYIKNLNTDKLWKFRPYYLSDDGTYHYGDWMGLDPTNTSYFEPTVHTYAKINIEGNTALVRGYALAGTDNIKVQGFKYWKTSGNNAPNRAPSVPANAQTIEAVGQQIITATLAALEYNTTYHYVAFVTTEDGTTYYGEEQVFTTPMPPAGIDDVTVEAPSSVKKKGVYTLTGVKLADDKSELQGLPQGMYVIDGKKVMIK